MSGDEGGEVLAPTSNIEGAQKRTRCQNGGCGREAVMGSCCLMGTVSVLQEKRVLEIGCMTMGICLINTTERHT